jgi:hypothetical protein
MDVEDAEFFLSRAARCRRLAREFHNQNDPAVKVMLTMAEDFEARAAAYRESLKSPGR